VNKARTWLIAGGCLSLAAALVHVATIFGGPDWYRFFGAGEPIARAAERGSWVPAAMTSVIAATLGLWAAYAFAAAGLMRRLPLMRTALVVISTIYLARGLLVLAPSAFDQSDLSPAFMLWSSLIVLVLGVTYAIGTALAWRALSANGTPTISPREQQV
jgi:heme/copper-type cytochrome/quinol oxidase subunit 3